MNQSVATIRSLVIDTINNANSGHPGMALGSAPALYQLFNHNLITTPENSGWINADSVDGMSIDHYTSYRDLHYKIWCIENGQFSRETWYKLMMVSLPRIYQNLLNEILN